MLEEGWLYAIMEKGGGVCVRCFNCEEAMMLQQRRGFGKILLNMDIVTLIHCHRMGA